MPAYITPVKEKGETAASSFTPQKASAAAPPCAKAASVFVGLRRSLAGFLLRAAENRCGNSALGDISVGLAQSMKIRVKLTGKAKLRFGREKILFLNKISQQICTKIDKISKFLTPV